MTKYVCYVLFTFPYGIFYVGSGARERMGASLNDYDKPRYANDNRMKFRYQRACSKLNIPFLCEEISSHDDANDAAEAEIALIQCFPHILTNVRHVAKNKRMNQLPDFLLKGLPMSFRDAFGIPEHWTVTTTEW